MNMNMNLPNLLQFSFSTHNNNIPEDNTRDAEDEILDSISPQEINDKLAEFTLEGKWQLVKKMYYKFPAKTHTAIIDEAVGTALHVAIDLDEEEVVRELVNAILTASRGEEIVKALEMVDEKGDTPLHVAASRGFAKLCKCIVGEKDNKAERLYLTRLKNKREETPLFLAALNWSKHAFVYLSTITRDTIILPDLIREDGDSILHVAIKREYFDLAVIIVHCYDFLSSHKNRNEYTPLKVLATRPAAFRSATKLAWWKQILYHCILVEPVLDVERTIEKTLKKLDRKPRPEKVRVPKNYTTLRDIVAPFCKSLNVFAIFGGLPFNKGEEHDAENQYDDKKIKKENKYEQIGFLPPNYSTFQQFIRSTYMHGLGLSGVALKQIKQAKKKHQWSGQLLEALMERPYEAFTGRGGQPSATDWAVDPDMLNVFSQLNQEDEGSNMEGVEEEIKEPTSPAALPTAAALVTTESKKGTPSRKDSKKGTKFSDEEENREIDLKETAFLVAARNGIVEMMIEILRKIPSAIHNTNKNKENVLLVAVINRQPLVVETLRSESKTEVWNNLILAVDDKENTMLHFAGKEQGGVKPWQIAGSALQMMWDIKWFQYVKSIVPQHFFYRTNKEGKTAGEIFKESHKELVKESSDWLKDTSESCSVVAALVAGVSFATASAVPGGTNDEGKAPLEGQPAFDAFAIASLIGLCFSVTGLIMFLSILTSRKEARDFRRGLPSKLLLGLSSLFVSIAAMFVSFCAGHFFVINQKYKTFLLPFYAATSLPVAFYAVAQFPLYIDLLTAILAKVPRASDKGDSL